MFRFENRIFRPEVTYFRYDGPLEPGFYLFSFSIHKSHEKELTKVNPFKYRKILIFKKFHRILKKIVVTSLSGFKIAFLGRKLRVSGMTDNSSQNPIWPLSLSMNHMKNVSSPLECRRLIHGSEISLRWRDLPWCFVTPGPDRHR